MRVRARVKARVRAKATATSRARARARAKPKSSSPALACAFDMLLSTRCHSAAVRSVYSAVAVCRASRLGGGEQRRHWTHRGATGLV